jgi:hypothetical protein
VGALYAAPARGAFSAPTFATPGDAGQLETGPAQAAGGWWVYVTQTAVAGEAVVRVTAVDLLSASEIFEQETA